MQFDLLISTHLIPLQIMDKQSTYLVTDDDQTSRITRSFLSFHSQLQHEFGLHCYIGEVISISPAKGSDCPLSAAHRISISASEEWIWRQIEDQKRSSPAWRPLSPRVVPWRTFGRRWLACRSERIESNCDCDGLDGIWGLKESSMANS